MIRLMETCERSMVCRSSQIVSLEKVWLLCSKKPKSKSSVSSMIIIFLLFIHFSLVARDGIVAATKEITGNRRQREQISCTSHIFFTVFFFCSRRRHIIQRRSAFSGLSPLWLLPLCEVCALAHRFRHITSH